MDVTGGMTALEILDPTGGHEIVQSHAPRLGDLHGKIIGELSNGSWEDQRTFPVLRAALQERFPDTRFIPYTEFPRGTEPIDKESAIDRLVEMGCDAVIVGNAACGSCSTSAGRAAARAEKRGIPSVLVARQGFGPIVDYAFAGMGFSGECAKFAFPSVMFLPDGDLSPVAANLDRIVEGLTRWSPRVASRQVIVETPRITVTGDDHQHAIDRMNHLFLQNLWSDGLPIVPPTEARVKWLLTGTDLPRKHVLGKILPRGGIATVETVAIAAAMAGCRPEYMPVLLAALDALLDPLVHHHTMQTTTGTGHPAVIVNGPVAKAIRLNSSYGCLGPSSVYPAGASIGRAIRFLLLNVGGAVPGTGSMSLYGSPGRYTGLVFAEDEAGLPEGWEPLSVERGLKPGANGVTVLPCDGGVGVWDGAAASEKEALLSLYDFAKYMGVPNGGYFADAFNPKGSPGILLIARAAAQGFADLGWSKQRIKAFLWEHSKLPDSDWLRDVLDYFGTRKSFFVKDHFQFPMPIAYAPENIMLVVTGGEQATHSFWMQVEGVAVGAATCEVNLPSGWHGLLAKAEEDLGPLPGA